MKDSKEYLLFDEECPMCTWYTAMFIKYGFLSSSHRISYNEAIRSRRFDFDEERGKNEIALLSEDTGEVHYGIDSLLRVIGNRWKWLERIGRTVPVYVVLRMLYFLISYNRKVIAPVDCNKKGSCEPAFQPLWRWSFMLSCGLLVHLIVGRYFENYLPDQLRPYSPWLNFSLFVAQILFQGITFTLLKQKNFTEYIGQLAVTSLLGAIVLGLIMFGFGIMQYIGVEARMLYSTGPGVAVGIMFAEHIRRCRLNGFTAWMNVSWIVFGWSIYLIIFER